MLFLILRIIPPKTLLLTHSIRFSLGVTRIGYQGHSLELMDFQQYTHKGQSTQNYEIFKFYLYCFGLLVLNISSNFKMIPLPPIMCPKYMPMPCYYCLSEEYLRLIHVRV